LLGYVLVKWTRTGAHMTATGEADEAARLPGSRRAHEAHWLLLSGLFAGVAALLLAGQPLLGGANMGGDYFLYAIAAVLLGMTMFEPGRPNIPARSSRHWCSRRWAKRPGVCRHGLLRADIVLARSSSVRWRFSASVLKKAAFKV